MIGNDSEKLKVIIIAHYFPPINSTGAKRFQFISKYLAENAVDVTVITTKKSSADGAFTENISDDVAVIELDDFGRVVKSVNKNKNDFIPLFSDKLSFKRKIKNFVMNVFGQLPDPRLPFSLSFLKPKLDPTLRDVLINSNIIIATTPPWTMVLAGVFIKRRFNKPLIVDYRDHFSENHEMPGNWVAKKVEVLVDKWLVSNSDHVVTISAPMKQYYLNFTKNISVIMNGYDFHAMEEARQYAKFGQSSKTIIRYMGVVSPVRIPFAFIEALYNLSLNEPHKLKKIVVEFYGNASLVKKYVAENFSDISEYFQYYDFVSYEMSLRLMIEADYVLFSETSDCKSLSSQGILTTKLFEYLGSGRPIIANISIETLPGKLILTSGSNHIVTTEVDKLYQYLSNDDFFRRKNNFFSSIAKDFTRKNQALTYKEVISRVARNAQSL